MGTVDDYTKKINDWLNSLSDIQKYSLLGMFLGLVFLVLAIILW